MLLLSYSHNRASGKVLPQCTTRVREPGKAVYLPGSACHDRFLLTINHVNNRWVFAAENSLPAISWLYRKAEKGTRLIYGSESAEAILRKPNDEPDSL